MNNKRVWASLAFLFGITALVIGTTLFTGCAAAPPPPPPVIVQAAPTPTPIADPYASLSPDVAEAIKHNQTPVLQHGITTVYPYSPDVAYPLNCQKLHVTQVRLRDDETTSKQDVKIGDVTRWGTIVGEHSVLVFPTGSTTPITVAGAQVTIPAEPSMITNLAIHSSAGRDYVFNPVKEVRGSKDFTQAISFYYPSEVRAQAAARDAAIKAGQQSQ